MNGWREVKLVPSVPRQCFSWRVKLQSSGNNNKRRITGHGQKLKENSKLYDMDDIIRNPCEKENEVNINLVIQQIVPLDIK
ncbi:unnamed protein product [Brassica napus]|uniref:(rape) hypothetical protein n=1 Tax=Brassica napus TaxID=3708 RepID=A0A816ZEH8_BRANA|nr:unnamed protein product [Brassica napus]